ncbi:hypothetical protein IU483_20780 [Streptomyces gardneri]|nr:hypothetical protein [Streptomyces gardneri]
MFRWGTVLPGVRILLLSVLSRLSSSVDSGNIVGVGEAGVVQVGEARVVDGLADPDGYQVPVGVDDDLPRPDAVDGVAGYPARGQYLGFPVAARVVSAMGSGVVEGGVYVDAVRVVQLVHIHRLPEGAVGQTCQLPLIGEPVEVVARDVRFPGDGVLRTPRQRHEAVCLAGAGVADVRTDVEVAGIAWREAEVEDLRPPRIHAEQGVAGVQERVFSAPVPPYRRQAVAGIVDHQPRGVDRRSRVVERLAGHGPGQVIGQQVVGAAGFECVGFDARVAPSHGIAQVVIHDLGEVLRVELVGSLVEWRLFRVLVDAVLSDTQRAVLDPADDVGGHQTVPGGVILDHPKVVVAEFDRPARRRRSMRRGARRIRNVTRWHRCHTVRRPLGSTVGLLRAWSVRLRVCRARTVVLGYEAITPF